MIKAGSIRVTVRVRVRVRLGLMASKLVGATVPLRFFVHRVRARVRVKDRVSVEPCGHLWLRLVLGFDTGIGLWGP